ncbi:MAG: proteasome accessory factor PafA2 family protein [Armatimonadetes bacterium]|nr:proteasome accessory factor PafA2 family protein [Armatimonadota bacterium]
MWPILVGLETEYGLAVEGRGAGDQVDDAMALVRSSPYGRRSVWDYRSESPRADLRGFVQQALAVDPEDAKFDVGRRPTMDEDVRSDVVLPNGARLYNDHGHPEYSTPECWSLLELERQDAAGESAVLDAAAGFSRDHGLAVTLYKNNTDGHGASYGTHENYLVPRYLGFARTSSAVLPVLIARQLLCGAGKVGSESGVHCDYQMSQRADFFTEVWSVDTLYRRPVFNTRDEPHADPERWMRLHVICGDANRIGTAVRRKVGLVKLALWLESVERAPVWRLSDPVGSFQAVSRDLTGEGRIALEGGNWTTAASVIASYVEAAERFLDPSFPGVEEALQEGRECCGTADLVRSAPEDFARTVDWAAKGRAIGAYLEESDSDWSDPVARSTDLAYHDVDPVDGLYAVMAGLGMVEPAVSQEIKASRLERCHESTRARARGKAVRSFSSSLKGASWGRLTFETEAGVRTAALAPDGCYPESLESVDSLDEFLDALEERR